LECNVATAKESSSMSCRWRQHVLPKRWYVPSKLHAVTSQKKAVFIVTVEKTLDVTNIFLAFYLPSLLFFMFTFLFIFLSISFPCLFFLWLVNEAMSAFGYCFSLCKLCEDGYCFEQVTWWHSYLYVSRKYLIQLSAQTAIISNFHIVFSTVYIYQVIYVKIIPTIRTVFVVCFPGVITHRGCIFHSPVAGYSLLVFEVSWSHTTTRHSR
jgi:hypothetical protein